MGLVSKSIRFKDVLLDLQLYSPVIGPWNPRTQDIEARDSYESESLLSALAPRVDVHQGSLDRPLDFPFDSLDLPLKLHGYELGSLG